MWLFVAKLQISSGRQRRRHIDDDGNDGGARRYVWWRRIAQETEAGAAVVHQLGRQDRGGDLYWVQDEAAWHGTHAKKAASPAVKAATCSGRAGSAGPRWASAGLLAGPVGRVGPTGSAQSGRIGFPLFSNLFLIPETIPENLEIVLKARKILEKSQKIQENSQS
jgi:hypothetical protein